MEFAHVLLLALAAPELRPWLEHRKHLVPLGQACGPQQPYYGKDIMPAEQGFSQIVSVVRAKFHVEDSGNCADGI
jgi:hypothetical protein